MVVAASEVDLEAVALEVVAVLVAVAVDVGD
jgi:hypothetical protein